MAKFKLFEERTPSQLEAALNSFAESHNVIQVSYQRREPIANQMRISEATRDVNIHCCLVMYEDFSVGITNIMDLAADMDGDESLMDVPSNT